MRITTMLIVGLCLAAAQSRGETFGLSSSAAEDTVSFRSQAKLEFIEGKTNSLAGSFSCNLDSLNGAVDGIFRVDLRTLKTGIDMRDEHMRERHLKTDSFPYAFFQMTGVSGLPNQLPIGQTVNGTVSGLFYIHGVKRKISATLEVTRMKGSTGEETVVSRARFTLKLDDYGIPRPKALFLKLAEAVDIEVIFTGHNNLAGEQVQLPDWPELK